MPRRPRSPCTEPGCPELVESPGPCPEHARRRDRSYKERQPWRAYDHAWETFRAQVLRERPYCQEPGCQAAATEVDHVKPLRLGGDRLSRRNVQALCRTHHQRKTNAENRLGGDASAR